MNPIIAILLSFIAGFVDTATFVGARGVFSAHVTGNFVLFSVALMNGVREIDYLKLFLFVPFVLAIAGVSQVKRFTPHYERSLILLASLFLAIPGIYFFGVTQLKDELWDMSNVMIMLPVLAMGIQNALFKILYPVDPMTTVMTGNVTSMVLELTTLGLTEKVKSFSRVILGFTCGCFFAAWAVKMHSLGALLIPAVMLASLAITKKE